jgi:hypothetical protein
MIFYVKFPLVYFFNEGRACDSSLPLVRKVIKRKSAEPEVYPGIYQSRPDALKIHMTKQPTLFKEHFSGCTGWISMPERASDWRSA